MSKIIRIAPTTKLPRLVTIYGHPYVFDKDEDGLVSCEVSDEVHRQRLCNTGAYSLESEYAAQKAREEQTKRDMLNSKTRELTVERVEQSKKNQEKVDRQIKAQVDQTLEAERKAMAERDAQREKEMEEFKKSLLAQVAAMQSGTPAVADSLIQDESVQVEDAAVAVKEITFEDDESLPGPKRLSKARHAYKEKFGQSADPKMKLVELLEALKA